MAIEARTARYIHLDNKSMEISTLYFGEIQLRTISVSDELAGEGDIEKISQHLEQLGYSPEAAAAGAREAKDFYSLGADCLWVTVARDHLWWTFADPQVIWLMNDLVLTDARVRKSIDGWRNTDVRGAPLEMTTLSGRIKDFVAQGQSEPDADVLRDLILLINGTETSRRPAVRLLANAEANAVDSTSKAVGTPSFAIPSALFTVADIIETPSAAPDEAGIYAWWFDELPNVPLVEASEQNGFRLAYMGIASFRPGSRRTLRQRLRNHCIGPIATSTLRRSLAAVLIDQLDLHPSVGPSKKVKLPKDEEARLSNWLSIHGRVAWIVDATPWAYETELLKSGPPLALNIRGNSHEFGRKLLTLRKQLSNSAISSVVS